jgi:hypothetical protein
MVQTLAAMQMSYALARKCVLIAYPWHASDTAQEPNYASHGRTLEEASHYSNLQMQSNSPPT